MSAHRSSLPISLAAAGILALPSAASAVENAVEFQLDADVILELFEERAQFVDPGCPQIFDAGLGGYEEAIVNHVDFGTPILMREEASSAMSFQGGAINVFRPKVRMPVDVHLKSVDCVNDPSCALDDTLPISVFLSFALTADTSEICATFTHSEGLFVPQEALDQVDEIVGQFGPMCAPLSLGAVTGLLGDAEVADVALSANTALDRIAIRLDMDTGDGSTGSTLSTWQTFMTGIITASGTEDFSVHVDESMLRGSFERQLTDGITCDESDPESDGCTDEIEPSEDPTSSWVSWVPRIDIGVDTDVEVWGCWDISTYVSLSSELSLASDGESIDVEAYLDWDPNDGELFACSIVNPLFAFTLPIPAFFGIMEGIAANYSAANDIEDALPSECELIDDHNVDCTFPFTLPELDLGDGPDGILTATDLRGVSSGLILEGDVDILGVRVDPEPLTLDGETPWYGTHGGSCDPSIGYSGWLDVEGGPGLYCPSPTSGLPSPMVIGDPLGVYELDGVGSGPDDGIEIDLDGSNDTFWDDPYGLVATVWTTVGSGTIALAAPVEQVGFDWEALHELVMGHVLCHFTEETGLFGIPGMFDFHWLVDPPPYELVAVGSQFDGAQATLVRASITQTAPGVRDPRSGAMILSSRSAVVNTTWLIEGGRYGRFEFTAQTPMNVDMVGTPVFGGFAYIPAGPTRITAAVPRAQVPRGATAASVDVLLDPASVAVTGIEIR